MKGALINGEGGSHHGIGSGTGGRRASVVFAESMKRRTKAIAVGVVQVSEAMGRPRAAQVVVRQMIRSATSAGGNYRAAQRAGSVKEFAARLGISIEETDQTMNWTEIAVETRLISREDAMPI